MHSGSHQLYMLASVVVWHVRKRKHCKARHSTALRRAVELAKLNGAGVCIFCAFSYTQLVVTRKNNLSPHPFKAIRCAHVLA